MNKITSANVYFYERSSINKLLACSMKWNKKIGTESGTGVSVKPKSSASKKLVLKLWVNYF